MRFYPWCADFSSRLSYPLHGCCWMHLFLAIYLANCTDKISQRSVLNRTLYTTDLQAISSVMRLGSMLIATKTSLTWASGHRNQRYNGSVHFQKLIWRLNDINKFRNVPHLGQRVDIRPSPPPTRIFYQPKWGAGVARSIKKEHWVTHAWPLVVWVTLI